MTGPTELPFDWTCPQCGMTGRTSLVDVRCRCGTVSVSSGAHVHTSDRVPPSLRTQTAIFDPKRRDNLREEAVQHIGRTLQWQCLWVVDEEDGGPYVGQTVWMPLDADAHFGWVPDEDLEPLA